MKQPLVIVLGLASLAATTLALGCPAAAGAQAVQSNDTSSLPRFATAVIHRSNPNQGNMGLLTSSGGRINAGHRTLRMLVSIAFNVQEFQVIGGPAWTDADQFDIDALPPQSSQAANYVTTNAKLPPNDELREMILALLIDRFHLQFHRETREGQIYLLQRGSGELKLLPPKDTNAFPWVGNVWERGAITDTKGIAAHNASMALLATRLASYLHFPVIDQTGIAGSFDFRFFNNDRELEGKCSQEAIVASIHESIRGIGLNLAKSKGPVETIVIDRAEEPSTGGNASIQSWQPQQAQTPGMINGSDLSGMWINVDPHTRGLVQIVIDGLNIHPFGACHPNPCDWGIVRGTSFAASVDSRDTAAMIAQQKTAFSETTLTLARETDERLRVDVFTHFTDTSNRADYHSTNFFTRGLRPAPAAARQYQPAAQSPVSPGGNQVLVVWRVGSPDSDQAPDSSVPLNLERKAESMGLRLQIRAFPAHEFAQEFQDAFAAHQEPDIIAVENGYTIEGPQNNPYGIVGIASDPDVRRSLIQVNGSLKGLAGIRGGWQFLISTSLHAEAARRFALRPAECDESVVAETSVPPDLQQAAVQIANAYLHAPAEMKPYEDADRLTTEGVRWDSMNVRETRTCGYWGNDRLAFVSLVSTFEHEDPLGQPPPISIAHGPLIGQMPILLVLRKQEAQWRLLVASSDPWSNEPFLRQIPAMSRLLREPAIEETSVAPAQLLSPENGHVPIPDAGQRFGYFTWQPSPSGNVVAQIAEFAYQNDDRLFFIPTRNDAMSAGSLWHTGSEWKWRVWSISDTGAIAFSDYRTFRQ